MDHLEAIVEIKNVVSTEFIYRILPLINHKAKKNLTVRSGLDKDIRNVKGYHLNSEGVPTDVFYWNFIKQEIERLYVLYKAKFPKMASDKINQIDLLKYTQGENTKYIQIILLIHQDI